VTSHSVPRRSSHDADGQVKQEEAHRHDAPTHEGELIGTCIRCGGGVGDQEWTFGAWNGERWCFSGRTLQGAKRLAAFRPLPCSNCAIRIKYKLIPPPAPVPTTDALA
jgi:hypothetical protein